MSTTQCSSSNSARLRQTAHNRVSTFHCQESPNMQPSYSGLSIEDENDVREIIDAVERCAIPTLTARQLTNVKVENRSLFSKPGNMIAWKGERFADGIVYTSRSRMTRKKMGAYKMVVSQNDQLTRIHIPCKFHGRPGLIVLYEATPPYPRASQLLPSMQSVQAYMHESRPSPASSESKRPGLDDLRKSGLKKRRILSGSAAASSSAPDSTCHACPSASASGYECLTQEPEELVTPGNDTVGADRSQMNGNLSIHSYHHVPLLESSGMKKLTEQVLLLMTDYATTSCKNLDEVWQIIKRNMEERVSSPVATQGDQISVKVVSGVHCRGHSANPPQHCLDAQAGNASCSETETIPPSQSFGAQITGYHPDIYPQEHERVAVSNHSQDKVSGYEPQMTTLIPLEVPNSSNPSLPLMPPVNPSVPGDELSASLAQAGHQAFHDHDKPHDAPLLESLVPANSCYPLRTGTWTMPKPLLYSGFKVSNGTDSQPQTTTLIPRETPDSDGNPSLSLTTPVSHITPSVPCDELQGFASTSRAHQVAVDGCCSEANHFIGYQAGVDSHPNSQHQFYQNYQQTFKGFPDYIDPELQNYLQTTFKGFSDNIDPELQSHHQTFNGFPDNIDPELQIFQQTFEGFPNNIDLELHIYQQRFKGFPYDIV